MLAITNQLAITVVKKYVQENFEIMLKHFKYSYWYMKFDKENHMIAPQVRCKNIIVVLFSFTTIILLNDLGTWVNVFLKHTT